MTAGVPDIVVAREVILASASASRRDILTGAGVPFRAVASAIDEAAIKEAARDEGIDGAATVMRLAEAKAREIARQSPDAVVIGADQMLECDGAWFDKPGDRGEAVASLERLGGRTHKLLTAAVVLAGGEVQWRHYGEPRLTMRVLDRAFIERYLDAMGADAFTVVGPYKLESIGAQLFTRIDGDYFTILGLPLLPLLDHLRGLGAVDA